jgi:hypothetical protein
MRSQARWVLACLVMLLGWCAPFDGVRATTTVRVIETYPAGDDITLGRNQNFYLRLAYASDVPAGIWVRPYFEGKPVNVGSSPSGTYKGNGETFGWFFFMQPGDEVDEVRIIAGDGGLRSTPVVASYRVHARGGSEVVDPGAEPAWVAENRARTRAEQEQAYRTRMSEPVSAGTVALFSGFMLAMLALGLLGLAAPAWGLWRWRGGWRLAAAVPAAMMVFVVLRIVLGVAGDPTSHNLWPFEILQAGLLSVVAMGVLLLVRRLSVARR